MKFVIGIVVVIGAAIAKYWQIQGWPIPRPFAYALFALASLFLLIFLLTYSNGSGRRSR